MRAIRESTQQNVTRAGDQITSRNLGIQPTITVRPGTDVRLIVHGDLILAAWREWALSMPDLTGSPDRTPAKLAITLLPDLHQMLQDYAVLYAEAYGQAEAVTD